jgi:hypothetical protein
MPDQDRQRVSPHIAVVLKKHHRPILAQPHIRIFDAFENWIVDRWNSVGDGVARENLTKVNAVLEEIRPFEPERLAEGNINTREWIAAVLRFVFMRGRGRGFGCIIGRSSAVGLPTGFCAAKGAHAATAIERNPRKSIGLNFRFFIICVQLLITNPDMFSQPTSVVLHKKISTPQS